MDNDGFTEIGGGETWNGKESNLKVGDHITGQYVGMRSNVGPNNAKFYTLRTSDGDQSIWGSTVLDGRFEQVSIGDIVRVTSMGESEKPGKFGKHFKLWKLESKPGPALASQLSQSPAAPAPVQDVQLDEAGELDVKDLGY